MAFGQMNDELIVHLSCTCRPPSAGPRRCTACATPSSASGASSVSPSWGRRPRASRTHWTSRCTPRSMAPRPPPPRYPHFPLTSPNFCNFPHYHCDLPHFLHFPRFSLTISAISHNFAQFAQTPANFHNFPQSLQFLAISPQFPATPAISCNFPHNLPQFPHFFAMSRNFNFPSLFNFCNFPQFPRNFPKGPGHQFLPPPCNRTSEQGQCRGLPARSSRRGTTSPSAPPTAPSAAGRPQLSPSCPACLPRFRRTALFSTGLISSKFCLHPTHPTTP